MAQTSGEYSSKSTWAFNSLYQFQIIVAWVSLPPFTEEFAIQSEWNTATICLLFLWKQAINQFSLKTKRIFRWGSGEFQLHRLFIFRDFLFFLVGDSEIKIGIVQRSKPCYFYLPFMLFESCSPFKIERIIQEGLVRKKKSRRTDFNPELEQNFFIHLQKQLLSRMTSEKHKNIHSYNKNCSIKIDWKWLEQFELKALYRKKSITSVTWTFVIKLVIIDLVIHLWSIDKTRTIRPDQTRLLYD